MFFGTDAGVYNVWSSPQEGQELRKGNGALRIGKEHVSGVELVLVIVGHKSSSSSG